MSKIYDNWERLVEVVLRREQLKEIALQDSTSLSSTFILSDFSFRLNSNFSTLEDSSIYQHDFPTSAHNNTVESNIRQTQEDKILIPIEGCSFPWDVEDLLSAFAEKLGTGNLGMTCKVMLDERSIVVVKRLEEVKIRRLEFEQQIQFLGSITHVNIVPIKAYFNIYENMCLVYDFCKQSVGSLLHDKFGKKLKPLDWDARQKIAIGTARGLAHIHTQRGGKLVHGNIKASNIFLNSQQYGCISDHCLVTVDGVDEPPPMQNTGYVAPEVTNFRQVSQESDVYSFGVLLLELLTRKSPDRAKLGIKVVGLVKWVNYVSSKKGTCKVFDSKLVKNDIVEEEMVKMLLIGMHCVGRKPEQRPKMADIVKMMEFNYIRLTEKTITLHLTHADC